MVQEQLVTHGQGLENVDYMLIILTTIRKTKINASRERIGTLWFNFLLKEGEGN